MKKFMQFLLVAVLILFQYIPFLLAGGKATEDKGSVEPAEKPFAELAHEDIFSTPAELVFWWSGEEGVPGMSFYIQAACDAYKSLHPNITVNRVHQSSENNVPNFLAAAEMQSGPDIVSLGYGVMNLQQVWAGNVAPISDYISGEEISHWIGKSFATWNDKVWSSDLYASGFVIIYRKAHFLDAGLEPEKPPDTWEELMDISGSLKQAGHNPFAIGFKDRRGFALYSFYFFPQFLTLPTFLETVVGERSFEDPDAMRMWKKVDEYNRAGFFFREAAFVDLEESWNEWRNGKGTMTAVPSSTAMMWLDELGADNVGIMSFPSLKDKPVGRVPVAPVSGFITGWSQNKELAADFLAFLHTEEILSMMIQKMNSNLIPADDRFNLNLVNNPVKKQVFEWVHSGFRRGTLAADGVIPNSLITEGLIPGGQMLISGDLSPQEAAEYMEKAAQEWRYLYPEDFESFRVWAGIK
jgi:multiple sugar transport system substrate-binding protein